MHVELALPLLLPLDRGSPTSGPRTGTSPGLLGTGPTAGGESLEVVCLNDPQNIPPFTRSMKKLSSTEQVPGASKAGACCSRLLLGCGNRAGGHHTFTEGLWSGGQRRAVL